VVWKRPKRLWPLVGLLLGLWALGMVCPGLYMWLHPDGVVHADRYTEGFWIRALKFTPPPHIPAFLFGIALADLDALIPRAARRRLLFGALGMCGIYAILYYGDKMPYPMMHDGLMMPLFALAILGLAGRNLIARFFGFAPFAIVGQSSYALYILHFNMWNLLHKYHVVARLHLTRYDPWLSYSILIGGAMLVTYYFEKPCQNWIRKHIKL